MGLVKTRAELQASPEGGAIRQDEVETYLGAYGGISLDAGSTAQTGIGTSFVKVSGFTANEPSNSIVPDHANDQLTVPIAGCYFVHFGLSFSGSVSVTFIYALGVDGVVGTHGAALERKMSTGGDVGNASFSTMLDITEGQVLTMHVKADGAAKSVTPTFMEFFAKKFG